MIDGLCQFCVSILDKVGIKACNFGVMSEFMSVFWLFSENSIL